jgi:Chaperone of endosialidase
VNSAGTIGSVSGIQSFAFSDANIILAFVNPVVNEISSARTYTTDPVSQVKEFSTFLGVSKKGMNYAGTANSTFKRSAGSLYAWGSNWGTENPSTKDFNALGTVSFYYVTRNGTITGPLSNIDPNNYDPTNGSITGVPGGNPYTYQRIYQSISGKVALLYGQKNYKTQGDAINGIDAEAESVVVPLVLETSFKWVGTVVVQVGIVQSFAYRWKNCGYFGCGDAGVAGTGGGNGDVFGPSTSVQNRLAIFADDTGKNLAEATFAPPASTGTLGQVLTSNGDGTTKWGTVSPAPTRASLPSDRKLKKQIKDLNENYIDKIMELRPVSFVWKETLADDIGFIAQEVKRVFPNLVEEDAGYIGVNYQKLVVPLVKAVQEQQKEIRKYQEIISKLEARVEKLEGKSSN